MNIVYDWENWSTTHWIVYFMTNENYLKLKPFLMHLGHFTTLYFIFFLNTIFFEFAFAVVHFWRHISVSLRNQFGILSIAVTWYNRAMAQFERGNIPALNFIISSQSELKPLNFFLLAEGAFWYPWFDDLTS